MKTSIKTFILLAFVILGFSACSKDDDPTVTYTEVNPLNEFLTKTGFNQYAVAATNNTPREYGFVFSPKNKGVIKSFMYNTPNGTTAVRVTLWDADTQTVLISTALQPLGSYVQTELSLATPFQLTANKNYAVTVNSDSWYIRQTSGVAVANYPVETDEINILDCGYKTGTAQVYPDTFLGNTYFGDISFKFQRN